MTTNKPKNTLVEKIFGIAFILFFLIIETVTFYKLCTDPSQIKVWHSFLFWTLFCNTISIVIILGILLFLVLTGKITDGQELPKNNQMPPLGPNEVGMHTH